MTNPEGHHGGPETERSPYDALLGPFCLQESLPEATAAQEGLVTFITTDGAKICPIFQFDIDENGERILNTNVSDAWKLYLDLFHRQMREDLWHIGLRLAAPRQSLGGKTLIEVLKDPENREAALTAVLDEADHVAKWSGVSLVFPSGLA